VPVSSILFLISALDLTEFFITFTYFDAIQTVPDVVIPPVTVPQYVFETEEHKEPGEDNLPFFTEASTGRELKRGQLRVQCNKAAQGFHGVGVEKGDVVLLFLGNTMEYPIILFGVAMIGGIVTTANPMYTVDELTKQVKDSKAKMIVTFPPLFEKANSWAPSLMPSPPMIPPWAL